MEQEYPFKITEISVNRSLRQVFTVSPNLFNIYVDDLVRKWK